MEWCYWMDDAQAHAQAGYRYLTLGDHTRARSHLRRSLALQNPSYSREGALRHGRLATPTCVRIAPSWTGRSFTAAALSMLWPVKWTLPAASGTWPASSKHSADTADQPV